MTPVQTTRTISSIQPARGVPAAPAQHTLAQSILLHLLPGVLIAVVFFGAAPLARQWQLPPFIAQCFADLVVLAPSVLGFLAYQGYRINGRLSLDGVVLYRDRLPWWQFARLVPVILVAAGGLTVLLAPLGAGIFARYFAWLPDVFLTATDLHGYSQSTLIGSYLVFVLMIVVTAPILEELYFRGYLLPRMARFGIWAPVIHSVLFAVYHVWSPWLAIGRAFSVLLLVVVVQWKRNIYLGMAAHMLGNSVDALAGVLFILQQF
jgi:membrane protease YdiL (CAAX protease family)